MALTYITTRSNLILNAFILDKSSKVQFSITVKAKSIIVARNVLSSETMFYIGTKGQSGRLPFSQSHSFRTATNISKQFS